MDSGSIERTLLSRPLPRQLPPGEGWVMPDYDGLSIANLPATIAALLGEDLPGALAPLPPELWSDWAPGLRRVVLVILDGLGYRMLQAMNARDDRPGLLSLASVFPSTTAAALVSLSTGRPPAEHGWLAYTMYLREVGVAANAILLSPIWSRESDLLVHWGLAPEAAIPVPSLAERLATAGVVTGAVFHARFRNTGFARMLYRGAAETWGHYHASDFWVQLGRLLSKTRGKRAFLTGYWSGLDTIGHAYGPGSEPWEAEFRSISHLLAKQFLNQLPGEDREGTLLLLTADHGQIHVPPEQILTASQDPELSQHLMVPIMGESRAAFVHAQRGRKEAIHHYLEDAFPGWFVLMDTVEALDAGLMGKPVTDETHSRAGDLLVLPRDRRALQPTPPPEPILGRHGGLTQEEMLVPLMGLRLDALAWRF
jgi:hypothetical protein